jgi:4-carboxymuconolactone decarboxylase
MARTPNVTRNSVPEHERAAFDAFVADRGEVPTTGPGSVMLNAPEVAQRALGLALYLRTDTSLDPRIRELAMLLAARENDCQFIWNAHAPPARRAGLRGEIIDALRDRREIPQPAPDEIAVLNYGREFFRTRRVSQGAFDSVVDHFGVNGATELTTLLGCYAMLAFNVNAFGVELPDELNEVPLPI